MVTIQKMVKIPQQKWYQFRQKKSKFLNKNGTISENCQNFSTKMIPFQKKGQNSPTKIVPFQKKVKNPRQNGTISEKGSKLLNKNGTISEKGQNSSTKMVPFQKRVKNHRQKWYHFSQKKVIIPRQKVPFQKRVKIPQQKWYLFRRGTKIVNNNGTISEKCRNSSTKWYHFSQKRVKIHRQQRYHFRKGQKFLKKILPFWAAARLMTSIASYTPCKVVGWTVITYSITSYSDEWFSKSLWCPAVGARQTAMLLPLFTSSKNCISK